MRKTETQEEVKLYNEELLTRLSKMMSLRDKSYLQVAKEMGCCRDTLEAYILNKRKISRRMKFLIHEWLKKNS